MADFFSKKEDKLPPLGDSTPFTPKPAPSPVPQPVPTPVVEVDNSVEDICNKVKVVLRDGGSVSAKASKSPFMKVYNFFTKERDAGEIRIAWDADNCILTAISTKKKNDSEL
jgi:hypothetical protein